MSNGHHVFDSKLGAVRVIQMKKPRPCSLQTMMLERNKVNITQGKVGKIELNEVRAEYILSIWDWGMIQFGPWIMGENFKSENVMPSRG